MDDVIFEEFGTGNWELVLIDACRGAFPGHRFKTFWYQKRRTPDDQRGIGVKLEPASDVC